MININEGKKNIVLFDINSARICGSVFEYVQDNKTKKTIYRELSYKEEDISNGNIYDFAVFYAHTLKTFENIAQTLYKETLLPIDAIYVNLSTPWMSAQRRVIHYNEKKEFLVTKELIENLIEKEIDAPLSQNMDFYHHEVVLFDRKTIDVFANGYPTRNPFGKKVQDIQVHSLTSVMSDQTKSDFDHIIERTFHRAPTFTSNIFVRYDSLKKLFPKQNDAIILDISGEITECMVVIDDHLKHIGSFPVGIHHISRNIAQTLNISPKKARGYLNLVQEGLLIEEDVEKIHRSFNIWLQESYRFFDGVSKQGLLPETIVLSATDDVRYWFASQILQSDELGEHTRAQKNFVIVHLAESDMITISQTQHYEMQIFAEYIKNNEIVQ